MVLMIAGSMKGPEVDEALEGVGMRELAEVLAGRREEGAGEGVGEGAVPFEGEPKRATELLRAPGGT